VNPVLSVKRGSHICCLNQGHSGCEGGRKCEVEIDISVSGGNCIGYVDEGIGRGLVKLEIRSNY